MTTIQYSLTLMTHTYEIQTPTQLHTNTTKFKLGTAMEVGTSITVPGNSKYKYFFLQFKWSTEAGTFDHSSEFV